MPTESAVLPRFGARVLWANPTPAGNVSVGAQDLHLFMVPKNTLRQDRDVLRISVFGQWAGNANGKTLKVFLGAADLTLAALGGGFNLGSFEIVTTVIRIGPLSQMAFCRVTCQKQDGTPIVNECIYQALTLDEAQPQLFRVTVTGTANDDTAIKGTLLEYLPADF